MPNWMSQSGAEGCYEPDPKLLILDVFCLIDFHHLQGGFLHLSVYSSFSSRLACLPGGGILRDVRIIRPFSRFLCGFWMRYLAGIQRQPYHACYSRSKGLYWRVFVPGSRMNAEDGWSNS